MDIFKCYNKPIRWNTINKKSWLIIITILITILLGICTGCLIYKFILDNNFLQEQLNYYEKQGYKNLTFPSELSSVHIDKVFDSEIYFHIEDEDDFGTICFDTDLKKLYYNYKDEKIYIEIDNVKEYLYLVEGTAVDNDYLFILDDIGNIYYIQGFYFSSVLELRGSVDDYQKINSDTYDSIKIYTYTVTPNNYNDYELIGIKQNKEYSIAYASDGILKFDEKEYKNERFNYVYLDFSYLYGDGNNYFEVEKNGKIKIYELNESEDYSYSDIIVKNIIVANDEDFIFIDSNNYLYSINFNKINKMHESKIKNILSKSPFQNLIIIFENGDTMNLNVKKIAKY